MNIVEYIEKLKRSGRAFKHRRKIKTRTDRVREYLVSVTGKKVATVRVGPDLVGAPQIYRGDGKIKPTGQ